MRGMALAAALAGAALLGVAGCGAAPAPQGSRPAVSPSPAGHRAGPPSCVTPGTAGRARTFTITEKDNGRSYCVTSGTRLLVFLHGTLARKWGPIQASSPALRRRPSPVMMLAIGVTGGYFVAASLGTATLTSVRGSCPPGASHCRDRQVFRVSVLVRGTM